MLHTKNYSNRFIFDESYSIQYNIKLM